MGKPKTSHKVFFVNCVICDKLFTTRFAHKKTCSKKCEKESNRLYLKKYHTEKKTYKIKHCKNCGKHIGVVSNGQAYCSWCKKMVLQYGRFVNKCKVNVSYCKNCGEAFVSKDYYRKYCTVSCFNIGRQKEKHLKWVEEGKNSNMYIVRTIVSSVKRVQKINIDISDIPQFLIDEKREYLQMVRNYREQVK